MMALFINPSTQEAEAGGLVALLGYIVIPCLKQQQKQS
jgi:hypothetical protein